MWEYLGNDPQSANSLSGISYSEISSYIFIYIYISIYNVPDRPVISSSGFLDHLLQPLAQAVKSYITDTNEF